MRARLEILSVLVVLAAVLLRAQSPASIDGERTRQAVERAIPLLQQSARTWTQVAGCVSCHHQGLGATTIAVARERGFHVDEAMLAAEVATITTQMVRSPAQSMLALLPNIDYLGVSYALIAVAASGAPADLASDVAVHRLLGGQHTAGHWTPYPQRLPLEGSQFSQTALTIRAIRLFAPAGRTDVDGRIGRAREWLRQAAPTETEDVAMQLFGLAWAGADARDVTQAKDRLLTLQRPDGGWSQIATRVSDAYATGQALVALNQAARVPVTTPAFRNGVAFLVGTQKPDGSWLVESRRTWKAGLPYLESGFPYGKHQFISYAGTAWATMALALTGRDESSPILMGARPSSNARPVTRAPADGDLTPLMLAALQGTPEDVQAVLRTGTDVNATATPLRLTALMCAVQDPKKVALLLSAGANVNVAAATGQTALVVAADYDGAGESVKLLLDRGADVNVHTTRPARMNTALVRAAFRGDRQMTATLLDHGAILNDLPQGSSALLAAVQHGDAALVTFLLDRGANIESHPPEGTRADDAPRDSTPLMWAVDRSWSDIVAVLLKRHANVNAHDASGMTPLMYAAAGIDRGITEPLVVLIAAGADVQARTTSGDTALALAERYGKADTAAILRKAMAGGTKGGGRRR